MTGSPLTDSELRDLLTAEAGGSSGGPGGWDDVVRRGRHRQRARRIQGVALVAVVAAVAATALALAADDPTVETVPPATDPTTTVQNETTATSADVTDAPDPRTSVTAGRAHGTSLTVIIPWADPTNAFDPCTARRPRVVESADQIAIELVAEDRGLGLEWASCYSSAFSGWATIELADPVGDRSLLDLPTGNELEVLDEASLLFPTELPDEFTPGVWDEFAFESTWTFSWSEQDLFVSVTNGYGGVGECDREDVEVRGTVGRLCRGSQGRFDLHWEEDGKTMAIEIGHVSDGTSPFTLDDVLAIAEGLRPFDEVGPSAAGT